MSTTASTLEVLITARNDATAGLNQLETQLKRASQSADATAAAVGGTLARAERAAAADALRLAQAEARGLSIKGDLTGASTRLGGAITAYRAQMDGSTASALKLVSAENQLASVQARVASSSGGLGGALGGLRQGMSALTTTAGALGLALGVQQLVAFGVSAARTSMELGAAQNALKQIAGDTQTYTTILAAAKQQQILFGGSLASNLNDMSSFAVSSRVAGADLNELIRTAQRLATLDPAQGIQGAKLALNEALSGNAVSLNRRFEIPKAMLDGLSSSATSAADKLAIVNQFLDKAGISANGAADTITKDAQAYNKLGAALDAIKTKAGGTLARGFAPAAEQLATSLGAGDQATQAAQSAKTFANYKQQLAEIDAALQKVWGSNDIVGRALGSALAAYQPLTQAQFAYVQALQAQGVATDAAIQKAQAYTSAASMLDQAIALNSQSNSGLAASLTGLIPAYAQAAASSDANAAAAQNVIAARLAGTITDAQAAQQLAQLAAQYQATTQTTQQAQAATDPYVQSLTQQRDVTTQVTAAMLGTDQALLKDVTDKQAATQQTATLNAVQEALASLGPAVASGLIASGQGARILASGYGIAIEQGTQLLNIQAQLANKQFQLKSAQIRVDAAVAGTGSGLGNEVQRDRQQQRAAKTAVVNENYGKAQQAQRDYDLALGSTDKKLSIFNTDLKTTVARYGATSAEAIKARQALDSFTQSLDTAAKRGGGGGGRGAKGSGAIKLSDQQKLNNSLLLDEQKANTQYEDEAIKHGTNLLAIAKDHNTKLLTIEKEYYQKRKDAQDAFNLSSASGAASFYGGLGSIKDRGVQQQASAEFEKALQDAEQIAKDKGADAGQAFLDAQTQVIGQRAQTADKLVSLQSTEGKNKGQIASDLNEAEYLKGVQRLQERANGIKLQQIQDAGSPIANAYAKQVQDENDRVAGQVAAENLRYEDAQGKIALTAERSAARRVTAAELAGKAITDKELPAVQALANAYGTLPGAAIPAGAAPTAPTTPVAAPVAPPSAPIPVAPVATVVATDTNGKLDAIAGKFDALLTAIGTVANRDDATSIVNAIGSAARDIKGAVSAATTQKAFV